MTDTSVPPTKPAAAARKKAKPATPRTAARGDIAPTTRARAIGKFVAKEAVDAAQGKAVAAALELVRPDAQGTAAERAKGLRAMLEGASADDASVLREALNGRLKGVNSRRVCCTPMTSWRRIGAMAATRIATSCAALVMRSKNSICRWSCSSCKRGSRKADSA